MTKNLKSNACNFCGKPLTSRVAKELGYGPDCGKKKGMPYTKAQEDKHKGDTNLIRSFDKEVRSKAVEEEHTKVDKTLTSDAVDYDQNRQQIDPVRAKIDRYMALAKAEASRKTAFEANIKAASKELSMLSKLKKFTMKAKSTIKNLAIGMLCVIGVGCTGQKNFDVDAQIALVNSQSANTTQGAPTLTNYANEFTDLATNRGIRLYFDKLNVNFGTVNPAVSGNDELGIAQCETTVDTRSTFQSQVNITVDQARFNALSADGKEKVIFHELGKCLLGKSNDQSTTNIQGASVTYRIPNSLMYSGPINDYNGATKDYYVAQLFGDPNLNTHRLNFESYLDNEYAGR